MSRFSIAECNMGRLEKKLTTIKNKCAKYGCEFSYEKVDEEYRKVTLDDGSICTVKFIIVDVEGKVEINDWVFVASVEYTEEGNLIKGISGIEVPERYYFSKPYCEHCGVDRPRKKTYIIQNVVNGQFAQVGRTCLKDYTNGMSAEAVADFISTYDTLIKGESNFGFGRTEKYFKTKDIVKYAAETVKHFGYAKKDSYRRPTSSMVYDFYCSDNDIFNISTQHMKEVRELMISVGFNAESKDSIKLAEEALKWVISYPESGEYFHNLKTLCKLEYVKYSDFGILVSLIAAYHNHVAKMERTDKRLKEKEREKKLSSHVGSIGDKVVIDIESVVVLASWVNDYNQGIAIYKIVDKNGNVYIWKTSSTIYDDTKQIKGTIKGHAEYEGVKQTELTRCRIS